VGFCLTKEALLDVHGKALFDGSLTSGISDYEYLSYFYLQGSELITLN
jgi:hypothetical protein